MSIALGRAPGGLKADALSTLGVAALGVVTMAPALGIYANLGLIAGSAGIASPAVFILALLCTLPTAMSYAFISREIPSAGSAYTWLSEAINPFAGTLVGLLLLVTYFIAVVLQPILFGLFFNDLLGILRIETGYLTWMLGVVIATGAVASLTYPGVRISSKGSVVLTILELAVVLALTATILVSSAAKGDLSLAPFDPRESLQGARGFLKALVFGLLSFVGFGVITTAAEETNSARAVIPRVMVVSCLLLGLIWTLSAWAFSLTLPATVWGEYVAEGVNPVAAVAQRFWGQGRILFILTAISAVLGVYVASVVGYSRVAYAMARSGVLPAFFARLHPAYQVPWNAQHVVFLVTLAVVAAWGRWLGLYLSYDWWGTSLVLFAVLSNVFVNIGCTAFFYRFRRKQYSWLWHGLIPLIGLLTSCFPLYFSFGPDLWKVGWKMGQSVVVFSGAVIVLCTLHAFGLFRRNIRWEITDRS